MHGDESKPTCFIAMPITTHDDEAKRYGDEQHWSHVMEALFVKAIIAADFVPIRPETGGAYLIHERIVKHLSEAHLVLCDLSSQNPNVLFELGVRTSLDKPIALVHDGLLRLPFDTSGINTPTYKPALNGWEIEEEVAKLAQHLKDSAESCAGRNPLWRQFGLTIRAQESNPDENPTQAALAVLTDQVEALRSDVATARVSPPDWERFLGGTAVPTFAVAISPGREAARQIGDFSSRRGLPLTVSVDGPDDFVFITQRAPTDRLSQMHFNQIRLIGQGLGATVIFDPRLTAPPHEEGGEPSADDDTTTDAR